jgi:hypothetical protein
MLSWIHSTLWKVLFGKAADSLEKSTEREDECTCVSSVYFAGSFADVGPDMIIENSTLVSKYVSVPKGFASPNCASFVAGLVQVPYLLYFLF